MAEVEDRHWWFVSRRAIVASLLDRLALAAHPQILEAGCGTGGNFPMLARRGQLYATELDAEARRFAASRGLAEIAPGRLPDDIPFGGRRFDLVVMTDVLEHLDNDVAALAALRARMNPGAVLIATVPALPWLWSAHDTTHHHRRRYRPAELRARGLEAGFEILKLSYYNFFLLPIVAAARLVQRFIGARRGGHDLRMPPPPVNWILTMVFSSERYLLRRISLPVGVSILMLARNPDGSSAAAR